MIWSPGPMRGVCPVNSSLLTPTHLLGWTEANQNKGDGESIGEWELIYFIEGVYVFVWDIT